MKELIKRRLVEPLRELIKQGLTPHELMVTLTIGVIIATFPMLGITTVLCMLAASAFQLNQVAIQIANYVGYPLQFILFIPLIRLGESVFGLSPVTINLIELGELLWDQPLSFVQLYGVAIGAACLVWAAIAVPVILLLNRLVLVRIRKSVGDVV